MKILRLRVRGAIGFKKGLNLDSVDLDFSSLQGLIAFSGENGSSKSTCLEMLHPYARLVSRKGSLQQHFYGKDAEKELSFEFQGDHYKTLIKIDSESGRSEGYLWKNKNEKSEVDGKISNYNKYIVELFGSPELFFNSVFCAQNSKKLNDMTTGDLKKLFSEFLRLDTLCEYENTAKQCGNLLTAQAEKLEREAEPLKELIYIYNEAATKLLVAKTDKQNHEQRLSELTNNLKQAETKLTINQISIQKNELIKAKITALQDGLDRIEKEIRADQEQSETELGDLRSKYRTIDTEVVGLESLLANESDIRSAAAMRNELSVLISKNKSLLEVVSKKHFAAAQATLKKETEKSEYSLEIGKLIGAGKNNRDTLLLKIKQAKLKTSDLDKRDPECKSTTCSFIVSALSAQKDIPKLESTLADQLADIKIKTKAHDTTLNRINAEIEALRELESDKKSEKDQLEAKITESEDDLIKIKDRTDELARIDTALARKNDLGKQRMLLADEGIKIKATWEKRITEKENQSKQASAAIKEAESKINKDAENNLPVITNNIALIKNSVADRTNKITEIAGKILSLEKEVALAQQAKKDFETKAAERSRIVAESSEWTYLKNACGKDGLRALEIDSVAPVITGYANDLLLSTFGPSYTVKFRTQDEETGREILDIIVIRDDGSEVLLDNLSGGEKVWSLKALRLAMTLITKEKSGKNFLSALADEEDGALDVDNAQNFIKLYRSFMPAGGFDDLYFISHKQECVAMSDHVVEFGSDGITID
jgi:exonuclease SbcC